VTAILHELNISEMNIVIENCRIKTLFPTVITLKSSRSVVCFCAARPHRLHAVYKMRPVATDVARGLCVCLYVCVLDKRMCCAKMVKLIEMPFGGGDSCGHKESKCIRWGLHRMNPFADARGDKSAMRPFAKLIIWTLVSVALQVSSVSWSVNEYDDDDDDDDDDDV